jgi:asparagine synthase (glutamine-hydrolysing)
MCGICGKISYGSEAINETLLATMCCSFTHRGPDDRGFYTKTGASRNGKQVHVGLGHQRLSIIDLSSAGQQPMSNEDGTVWVTFNGEIYNYKEIRSELKKKGHVFRSDTDTEVLIHMYEDKGLEAVHRLNGMFAFALWDENLNRLWVCRDRIGIKPLVYYWNNNEFAFASEIKALLNDPLISKELDIEALQLYLAFNYVPAPYTIFKGIRKLKPGQYLILQNHQLELIEYWETPQVTDSENTVAPSVQLHLYKDTLFSYLEDAVRSRMIADVPLGAFLSGGIDSSIIVALMARNTDKPVKTFSIGFEDADMYDESGYAREVAELNNTDHHEFKLTHTDLIDVFVKALSTFDEPFADSSAIPTFIVSRETREHVTVALSGDGGDELFAGYRSYLGEYWFSKYMLIPGLIREALFENIVFSLPDSRDSKILDYVRRLKKFIKGSKGSFPERLLAIKEIFPGRFRNRILLNAAWNSNPVNEDPALNWIQNLLSRYRGDRINTMLYSDFKDSLPGDMLTKVDWMSMKNSLEVRVPFLDHRVVELAFQMQGSLKLYKGKTKYILKETFKDLLPPSLLRRPKAGFEIPISRWLKTDLKFLIDDYLSEQKIKDQGIFDYNIIHNLLYDHFRHKTDTSWMLWNLIVFQFWYEKYFKSATAF